MKKSDIKDIIITGVMNGFDHDQLNQVKGLKIVVRMPQEPYLMVKAI